MPAQDQIVWFRDLDRQSGAVAGGKGANLGEMLRANFPVPNGFVVTAQAYRSFLDENKLVDDIKQILADFDPNNTNELQKRAGKVRDLIRRARMPKAVADEILKAYHRLGKKELVAIRSSATAEDLPEASFAGQQATFLNIAGDTQVLKTVQAAWASLFETRAVFYRATKGFDHLKVAIAVPIQKMVQSDVSGVMFSANPVTADRGVVIIEAIWGLGENIVQGTVTPDHYEIEKDTWEMLREQTVKQTIEMNRRFGITKNRPSPRSRQQLRKLSREQILQLAKLAIRLDEHYNHPQDIEWAIENGQIYIVQTRPITTLNLQEPAKLSPAAEAAYSKLPVLLRGEAASPGIVSGKVRISRSTKEMSTLKVGEILVTTMTTPDFVPAMKKAGAIVTDRGGQTSHAAIVSRELGVPCVVGTGNAMSKLKTGDEVTVNGALGEVVKGKLALPEPSPIPSDAEPKSDAKSIKTATKPYLNLAEPNLAHRLSSQVDGIGLLRAEFMIAGLGHHPRALIERGKGAVFTHHLEKGLREFCRAFGDRPVVYRTTDFKSNEYRHLIGGDKYEPEEENPLMGLRGCARYAADPPVFALEIEALCRVREDYKNLWLMLPFVRGVKELQHVKSLVAQAGLRRSSTFKIWMMVETPENVLMIDDYLDAGVDGISIGTNDLTMLLLGVDRDNETLAHIYEETHPAVLWAMERTIRKCKQRGVTVSVCGQAPSTHHNLIRSLVEWGVTSLSVAPDVISTAREAIADAENDFIRKRK